MRSVYIAAIAATLSSPVQAQTWHVDAGSGLSFAKLMPQKQSTPANGSMRYGFTASGLYFSPELHFAATERHHFTFGYQYSNNAMGVLFRTQVTDIFDWEFDMFELHNFSVGYQYHQLIFGKTIHVAAYARTGLAYGYNTGAGACSNVGHYGSETFSYYDLRQESKISESFWTPNSTVGVALGPNFNNRRMADRLTLQASVTACWKSVYSDYSTVQYTLVGANGATHKGSMQYQGAPLLLQVGLNFRLLDFTKKE